MGGTYLACQAVKGGGGVLMNTKESILALQAKIRELGYSNCTEKNYTLAVSKFFEYAKTMQLGNAPEYYVRGYIMRMRSAGLLATTINLNHAAIKFFFEKVKNYPLPVINIPYMKEPKKLPGIFSVEEIEKILSVKMNPKHRLMIELYYGCGLRRSEVISIKIKNVSLDRGTICIFGKGMKDRIIRIKDFKSGTFEPFMIGKKADDYLFESEQTGTKLSKRTPQKVFENACRAANVSKPWNLHRLRHSYATHLLEGGTDVTYIQKLLGHSNIKTTMIYLEVTNDSALKIKSPLVNLKVANA
jgi:integrase/recombinase XerD